jgi:hypothetical protein
METTYDEQNKITVLEAIGFECLGSVADIWGKKEPEFLDSCEVAEWNGLSIVALQRNSLAVMVGSKVYELNVHITSDTELEDIICNLDWNLDKAKKT